MSPGAADTLEPLLRAINGAASRDELVRCTRELVKTMPALAHDPPSQQRAIACCLELLRSNNPGAALLAVKGLVDCGAVAVEPLLNSIDERDYGARAWAVRALAALGDRRGLAVLRRAVAQDIGPSVRQAAAHGLGRLTFSADERSQGQLECLESLETGLEDEEWAVRYASVVALQTLLNAGLEPELRRRVTTLLERRRDTDDTLVVRLRALQALEQLPV